ncbi:MAG: hypothetical protein ACJASG_002308 [Oleiphilaceae bacterium]|jgi:hypothetical protein
MVKYLLSRKSKKQQDTSQSKSIAVELNLASSAKESPQWVKVKLLFVRSVDKSKQQASKHDCALFLTTGGQIRR